MVTGDYKGVVLVWSLEDGYTTPSFVFIGLLTLTIPRSCVASLNTFVSSKDEHSERLTALQLLPMHLVTTSGNGQMCFFNIATWTLEREIQAHNALCSGVVWTGNELVTTGLDNRMKVWSYSVIDSEIESVLLFEKSLDGVVHLRSGERSREIVTVEYPGSPNGVLGKTMKMCTWNLNKAKGLVEM